MTDLITGLALATLAALWLIAATVRHVRSHP